MANLSIVLAHGVLGFGGPASSLVSYFNGVAAHLIDQGHHVFEPQVDSIGTVEDRGSELAAKILGWQQKKNLTAQPVHIIAHSMGGLDARYAISQVQGFAPHVATLVTIGTPHRGSPVADAVATGTGPLAGLIEPWLSDRLKSQTGALNSLTTAFAAKFDPETKDDPHVRYLEVAGDASQGKAEELVLFALASRIGQITGEVNDGVVPQASALRPGHEHVVPDWPVDHAGEVGWGVRTPPIVFGHPLLFLPPPPHLAWYDAIVARL
jgi:triacylglycerol lipase